MQNFPNANQLSAGHRLHVLRGLRNGLAIHGACRKTVDQFRHGFRRHAGMSILFLTAFYLLRQSRRWPRVPDDPGRGRAFGWINAIQWTAVFIVAFSFAKLHIDAYVISAITAIIASTCFRWRGSFVIRCTTQPERSCGVGRASAILAPV